MLLNDVYYEAGEMESRALRRPAPARPTTRQPNGRRSGPRRRIGEAFIGLGVRIAGR